MYSTELVEPPEGNFIFPLYEASVAKLNLFQLSVKLPSIAEREALPLEGPAPPPVARKRKTYVTLERAIKYGKTIGCKVCDRIAEGVPHSDACQERFRTLLQEDRMAKEASARGISVPGTPAPDTPVGAPRTPAMPSVEQDVSRTCAPHPQNSLEVKAFFASCHAAPGEQDHGRSSDDSNPRDFGEYDDLKSAWKMNHVRPRKRLYAPVGKDCPFSADEIGPQRVTEWKFKGVVSVYKDNWQVHPHQRISSKSWIGTTWFFPNKKVDYDHAKV